jgi:hypothetical protein
MRSSVVTGVAAGIGAFLIGTIILFGRLPQSTFVYWYLLFLAVLLGIVIYLNRDLPDDKDLAFVIIMAALLAISLSLFMGHLRIHYDTSRMRDETESSLNYEIEERQAKLDYYTAYSEYLSRQIDQYVNVSKQINAELAVVRSELEYMREHPKVIEIIEEVPVEVPAEQPQYQEEEDYADDYEREEEEEDD